jgi:hypothetical protein
MINRDQLIQQYNEAFIQAEQSKNPEEREHAFLMAEKLALKINDLERKGQPLTNQQYNPQCIERLAIITTLRHNCLFISDVAAFLPVSRTTFYEHDLNKSDKIKQAINYNKVKTKHSMRAKWYKSENATLQVALYKLLANEDELQRLTMNNINIDEGLFDGATKEELEDEFYLPPTPEVTEEEEDVHIHDPEEESDEIVPVEEDEDEINFD